MVLFFLQVSTAENRASGSLLSRYRSETPELRGRAKLVSLKMVAFWSLPLITLQLRRSIS